MTYFTFFLDLWQKKKCSINSFLAYIFLRFMIHFLISSGTNFITNIKYGVWGWKKSKTPYIGFQKCQQEIISAKWLKLAKFEKFYCLSWISVPQTQTDHPEIDQSCFTECRILKMWKKVLNVYFLPWLLSVFNNVGFRTLL